MTWNLYVDDVREPPTSTEWVVARTSAEAIKLVEEKGCPQHMSLDHDLGGEDTTIPFVRWLVWRWFDGHQDEKLPTVEVHSSNPVGRDNLLSLVRSWKQLAQDFVRGITDEEIEAIAHTSVFSGLAGWIGDGPCPCNIIVHADRQAPGAIHNGKFNGEDVWSLVLAKGQVVFTTEDAAAIRLAVSSAVRKALRIERSRQEK